MTRSTQDEIDAFTALILQEEGKTLEPDGTGFRRRPNRRVRDHIEVGANQSTDPIEWAQLFRKSLSESLSFHTEKPNSESVFNRRRQLAAYLDRVVYWLGRHPDGPAPGIEQLALLSLAIEGINLGRVHELFSPPAGLGSGAPTSPADWNFRRHVLLGARLLHDAGVPNSDYVMADMLTRAGFRGQKTRTHFPQSNIASWRAELGSERNKRELDKFASLYSQWRNPTRTGLEWPPSESQARAWASGIANADWLNLISANSLSNR